MDARALITSVLLLAVAATASGCSPAAGQPEAGAPPPPATTSTSPASAPASTAASTPASTPSAAPQSTPPTRAPTPVPAQPVGFCTTFGFPDGVTARVTRIKRTEAAKPTKARRTTTTRSKTSGSSGSKAVTLKQGAALQELTLRVTNGSDQPLQLSPRASMTYGPKNRTAAQVRGRSLRTLAGSVAPGRSKTGTLVVAVPARHIHRATLRLGLASGRDPAVFAGSLGYTPGNSVQFNDPTGSKADQLRITRHIERSIDGTPAGSTIRIVQYSFDITSSLEKLVAAHERGVHIQMIVDQHDQIVTKQTRALIDLLGSNRKKKSFLIRCGASCMSNRASTMHAKYYLFSTVGSAKQVSMVGSANITHTNSKGSWNDMQTVVGDATLYTSLKRYFTDMARDDNDRNYYRTTTSGPITLYFFPRAKKHRVLLLRALDDVECSGAASGYGTKGLTAIRVTMYSWRVPRIDIAKKLWRLHDDGCDVRIILNRARTDLAVKRVLSRRSEKHGVMDLYDAWVDRNGNDVAERYMHQKGIAISGVWKGRPDAKVVYSGSANLAPLSTTDNNEIVVRREGDAIYDAYAENFRFAVKNGTRRLY